MPPESDTTQLIEGCKKILTDATKVKDELEKKIKMHTQIQEQISTLENSIDFKSEEELRYMIEVGTKQMTAYRNATELHAQLTKSQQEIAKMQQEIAKLQQEIQKGLASPKYIPAKQLIETMNDLNVKRCAVQKAQTLRSKIDQAKRSSELLTENELKRAKCVLQNIKVWQLIPRMILPRAVLYQQLKCVANFTSYLNTVSSINKSTKNMHYNFSVSCFILISWLNLKQL